MDSINSYSINYNDINILITIKSIKYVLNQELTVIEVIKENGNRIYLGDFYVQNLPKNLNREILNLLAERLIDNFDIILFDKGRFIGIFNGNEFEDDDEISYYLTNEMKSLKNQELKRIYMEFKSTKKGSKEFKKYSYFLELYFNGHPIPDSVREAYLRKKRKSFLYYPDLDSEIKKEFEDNIPAYTGSIEYQNNLDLIEQIKNDMKPVIEQLNVFESFINVIKNIKDKLNSNKKVKEELDIIKEKIPKTSIFSQERNLLRKKVKELKDKLVKINITEERQKLKDSIEIEYKDLIPEFESTSLDDIESILQDKYDCKNKEYNDLKDRYDTTYKKIDYYEQNQIDISDLYDRIEY